MVTKDTQPIEATAPIDTRTALIEAAKAFLTTNSQWAHAGALAHLVQRLEETK